MPRVIEKTIYQFGELSDEAKEHARAWFREGALDYDWWEHVYEDAEQCGRLLGIEFDRKKPGRPNSGPDIQFSGFSSQGDGASFDGRYSYAKACKRAIREHAPTDRELHRIADCLVTIQRQAGYRLTAITCVRGHYSHSGCMRVEVDATDGRNPALWEDSLTQLLRDFADWIYDQLEREYDWQMADEQVDENIRANEYEFSESGRRAC